MSNSPLSNKTVKPKNVMYPAIRVIHGPSDMSFDNLSNVPVGTVWASLRVVFNIPCDARAWVNGSAVNFRQRLRGKDVLEFIVPWGHKGGGEPKQLGIAPDDGDGEYITLNQAADLIPGRDRGKRVSLDSIWRWCIKGVRGGTRLQSVLIGGRRFTTRTWLREFINVRNNPTLATDSTAAAFRTPTERQRSAQQASEALRAAWKRRKA